MMLDAFFKYGQTSKYFSANYTANGQQIILSDAAPVYFYEIVITQYKRANEKIIQVANLRNLQVHRLTNIIIATEIFYAPDPNKITMRIEQIGVNFSTSRQTSKRQLIARLERLRDIEKQVMLHGYSQFYAGEVNG